MTNKIYIIGIGPGDNSQITPEAQAAIAASSVIIGYKPYIKLIENLIEGKEILSTGMKKERERASLAFAKAREGKTVAVISSGDACAYGMAPLMWEMKAEEDISDVELQVVPGISAMFAASALLGAALGHDFCAISLSDLLTPWQVIEKRIEAAASSDFVTAIYNPYSNDRYWQLHRLKEIFMQYRSGNTPVGVARQIGRAEQHIQTIALAALEPEKIDMFTLLLIGNSQSYIHEHAIITPRGYYGKGKNEADNIGRRIMNESFRHILSELDTKGLSDEQLWVSLHCIHTTADFNIAQMLYLTPDVVSRLHAKFFSGTPPVIVTDVRMVKAGIREKFVRQLGIEIKCYLDDERTTETASAYDITRTQAGIRLAVEEHPDAVFVFGNAPTALIELTKFIRQGKADPIAVIAAPVGFVNVKDSKWRLKYGCPQTPAIIVEGRKGGSNVAATIINAILSWNEAQNMHPGEGV